MANVRLERQYVAFPPLFNLRPDRAIHTYQSPLEANA
jgi:hypothetical protein